MLKKSLIAATIAASVVSAANAATITPVVADTVGVEYAALTGQVALNPVVITTGSATPANAIDYQEGSVLNVSISGATFTDTDASGADLPNPTISSSSGSVQFLQYSADMKQAQFLVTGIVTNGSTVTVSGLHANTSGAAASADPAVVEVKIGSSVIVDTVIGAVTRDVASAVGYVDYQNQLTASVATKFDGVVDVNEQRQEFVSGTTDVLTLSTTNAALTNGVTVTGATYTVYGDFSFLDLDGDGTLGETDEGNITASAGTLTLAEDYKSVAVAMSSLGTTNSLDITVTVPGDVVIPDQSFSVSAVAAYNDGAATPTTATKTLLNMADAGAWTLNGANVHVPFMPFGNAYSQSVTISNTSNQAGSVDVTFYVGDDTVTVEGIATAKAEGVTDISAAVRSAAASIGVSTGSLSFDLTVNAPSGDVEVTALYYAKADGDRLRTK